MTIINNSNYASILATIRKHGFDVRELNLELHFTVDDVELEYGVEHAYLFNRHGTNDRIFSVLKLNKMSFCRDIYGYEPPKCDFPECRTNTKECLINIIEALFKECCNASKPVKKLDLISIKTSFVGKIEEPIIEKSSSVHYEDLPW